MARVCKHCAKKGEKIYLKIARSALSMVIYICPRCDKKVMVNRK